MIRFKTLSVHTYILAVTVTYIFLYHTPFFSLVFEHADIHTFGGIRIFLSVVVALFVVNYVLLSLLSLISLRLLKWVSLFFFIGNAIALYFVNAYHALLDKTMMGNVFHTDTAEALSYYHPKIILYVVLLGLLPTFLFSKVKIVKQRKYKQAGFSAAVLFTGVFILYLNASTWLWMDRYAKRLGGLAMPWSYTINTLRFALSEAKKNRHRTQLPPLTFKQNKPYQPTIVILVIGESARAKNFSLYGYERNTNPLLRKEKIIALPAHSTATYTTASVHSILSSTGDTDDTDEILPDYLHRHGVKVIWRANNWGAPEVNASIREKVETLRQRCKAEGCDYDEVLLYGLSDILKHSKEKRIFIVLHTAGSHGPAYFRKYPSRFEYFKPVCKTVEIQNCTQQTLINAYDNTILYTDYFLAKVISILKEQKQARTLMLYVSDHGESLGEHGFYLHGSPYAIAPNEQKEIPFILWASPSFLSEKSFALSPDTEVSQHYVFHTVLGAFSASSSVYRRKYDLFAR